jgi:hypothetical protein
MCGVSALSSAPLPLAMWKDKPRIDAFRQAMELLGWTAGRNLQIEDRTCDRTVMSEAPIPDDPDNSDT